MDHPEWYYNGASWQMRLLRFLNLLEDSSVKLSLTSIGVWASTVNSVYQMAFVHDLGSSLTGLGGSATWLIAHTMRRKQLIDAGKR